VTSTPKATSFSYGDAYQLHQAETYRNRATNHWRHRIQLAHSLTQRFALPRLAGVAPANVVTVDVGCSIGTFAIEFAKLGYSSYGVDFDPSALDIARQLAREEGVAPEFVRGDVSDWSHNFPRIDIAICFDVFEHLHDDELGAFLVAIRNQLSERGSLVFHTFPAQYDYVFHSRALVALPLVPFAWLPPPAFARLARTYASLIDVGLLLATGSTYKERIKQESHCNPTTLPRLTDILKRAGYEILVVESADLFPPRHAASKWFADQPIAHRNIYGVAVPGDRSPTALAHAAAH
jgi:2-polyprenyl-3-methyl-5-hydroxy-6-metoxy-1,4-benzoquinol methylase